MTISGLGTTYEISSLSATLSATSTTAASTTDVDSTTSTSDATLSDPGQLLAKLKQLQQQDPAKFKEVVSKIAEQLSKAAEAEGTDTADGQFLTKLAGQFKKVAETGDLSALQPPPPPSDQGVAAYSSNSGQSDLLKALEEAQQKDSANSQQTGPSDSIKSLFQQINQQVTAALA